MTGIIAFFTGTRTGRALGLAIILTVIVYGTYKVVDHRAFKRGHDQVQADWDAAKAAAQRQAAAHGAAQTQAGREIAATARTESLAATTAVQKTTAETKEVIRYVYRDPPKGAPVRFGSCVYPLDPRVQQRIELGVDQARSAAR